MSVAPLSAQELATFAAITHKLDLLPYDKLIPLCQTISAGNCAAWAATYSDRIEPADADELERELLNALADENKRVTQHFGPLAYNMIANNGQAFVELFGQPTGQADELLEAIRGLEEKATSWQDHQRKQLKRKEENAVAFDVVGKLPMATPEEIRQMADGRRVIIARFRVNESDPYTDYHGGRQPRQVVIGFGKGKRENFKQLRKAAALFPATTHLGPDKGQWSVWVNREANKHGCIPTTREGDTYATREEAQAYVDALIQEDEKAGCGIGIAAKYHGYDLKDRGIENRENYSMGGGNYLGYARHDGWSVSSQPAEYLSSNMEVLGKPLFKFH